MTRVNEGRWPKLLAEGTVIVLSILVAFVLDAWWDGRQFRRELAEELSSVARELDKNRKLVRSEIRALERIIAGGEAFVELAARQSGSATVPVTDSLAYVVGFWSPTLDLSFGAVDALIASGRLSQIRDAELRLGLAGLQDAFEDGVEGEVNALQIVDRQLFPLLARATDFRAVYQIDKTFYALSNTPYDNPLPGGQKVLDFPASLEVRNLVLNRTSWLGGSLGEFRQLLVQLDSMTALIRT